MLIIKMSLCVTIRSGLIELRVFFGMTWIRIFPSMVSRFLHAIIIFHLMCLDFFMRLGFFFLWKIRFFHAIRIFYNAVHMFYNAIRIFSYNRVQFFSCDQDFSLLESWFLSCDLFFFFWYSTVFNAIGIFLFIEFFPVIRITLSCTQLK